jgi:hypothetical protein
MYSTSQLFLGDVGLLKGVFDHRQQIQSQGRHSAGWCSVRRAPQSPAQCWAALALGSAGGTGTTSLTAAGLGVGVSSRTMTSGDPAAPAAVALPCLHMRGSTGLVFRGRGCLHCQQVAQATTRNPYHSWGSVQVPTKHQFVAGFAHPSWHEVLHQYFSANICNQRICPWIWAVAAGLGWACGAVQPVSLRTNNQEE